MKILNGVKVKPDGLFSFSYVSYKIRTEPLGVEVSRRFKQFEWLHSSLKNRFPANYVSLVVNSDTQPARQGDASQTRPGAD